MLRAVLGRKRSYSRSKQRNNDQEAVESGEEVNNEEDVSKYFLPKNNRLLNSFFFQPVCFQLAQILLGKVLCRKIPDSNITLKGMIVETEAYLGEDDAASHSYKGRRTDRNEPMFMKPGTAYVYFTYGMYHCFNISSREEGSAVLIRALEPLEGLEQMEQYRGLFKKSEKSPTKDASSMKSYKKKELCNGPSKLCIALNINKVMINKEDLVTSEKIWLEDQHREMGDTVSSSRIGISGVESEEWRSKELRFYILGNECVSSRDRKAEHRLMLK